MRYLFIFLMLQQMSFASCFASPVCGAETHPKNRLTEIELLKATEFKVYETKLKALKALEEGYLIDLKQSEENLRDDEDFLLRALETYPTKHQLKAYASNCHDIFPKDLKIYNLASERLKKKQSFKKAVLNSRYGKFFLKNQPF